MSAMTVGVTGGRAGRLRRLFTRPADVITGGESTTTGQGPDLTIDLANPQLFSAYPAVPGIGEFAQAIIKSVDGLADAGASDMGTPTMLDPGIRADRDLRNVQVRLERLERDQVLSSHISGLVAQVAIRGDRIQDLEHSLAEAERDLQEYQAVAVSRCRRRRTGVQP